MPVDDSHDYEQYQMEHDDTRAEEQVENQVSEEEDSILDEILDLCTVKYRSQSKSKKFTIPDAVSPSDSEDEIPRPPCRTNFRVPQELEPISKHCQQELAKKLKTRRGRAGNRVSR